MHACGVALPAQASWDSGHLFRWWGVPVLSHFLWDLEDSPATGRVDVGGAAAAGGGRPGPGGRHPRWAACLGTNSSGALGAAGCCWVALPSVSVSSGWPPRPLAAALRVAGVHPACWRPPRGAHPRSCTPAQPALGTGLLGNRRAVRAISAAGASAPDLTLCPSLWVAGGEGPPGSRARPESGAPS